MMDTSDLAIPDSWQMADLGLVCDLINGDRGKNYPGRKSLAKEGIPFVNAGDLQDGIISNKRLGYVSPETFDLLRSGKFAINDILYCIRGSLGKVAFNQRLSAGAIASSLIIVRPNCRIVPKYVFYYLMSPLARSMIAKFDNGTAQPNLSGADLARFEIPIPSYRTQLKIVEAIEELFSELDNGVESLTTAQQQLVAYRESVLKQAFEGKLTTYWRDQNKHRLLSANEIRGQLAKERQEFHKRLADGKRSTRPKILEPITALSPDIAGALPSLPASWAWEKLAWTTCGVEYGTAAKSSKSGFVPVVRMGNLQNGRIDWSDLVFTSDPDEIEAYQLTPGDVLFNRTNSPELVGKTAIYKGERPALFAGYLIRINHNPAVVDGQYLTYFLNSPIARKYGNSVKTDGVNQSNINGEKLQAYPFPYTCLDEQREIVRILDERLSTTEGVLEEIDCQLDRAHVLRQSILMKGYSGQLVPQDTTDEPASVLLERIRFENETRKKKNGKKEAA